MNSITTTSNGKEQKHINIKVGILWGKIQIKSYKNERERVKIYKKKKKLVVYSFDTSQEGLKKFICYAIQ